MHPFFVLLTFKKRNKPGFSAIIRTNSKARAEELKRRHGGFILSIDAVRLNISKFSCVYAPDCSDWLKSLFGEDTKIYVKIE